MKKIISICLVAILVVFSMVPALATESSSVEAKADQGGIISPRYVGISSVSAGIDINWLGRAACSGTVSLSNNSYSVLLTVTLQRYNNGVWTDVTSWTSTGSGYGGTALEGYYYVTSGTYRVRSNAKVYNSYGTLIENESVFSGSKTY